MLFLRQSTASQEVPLGPFLDDTDGKTPETGLTIANTDIKLWKSGGTSEANKNSGGATHIASGRYYAVLDATDTDTVGPMEISVAVSGALPVRRVCCVLHASVYDVLFGSVAPSTHTAAAVQALVAAGAVASVTGNVGGNVVGSVGSVTGAVTVGTNNDKTGYTASTVTDKTGYSLAAGTGLGNQTANITGNLSGSVGSVTGAVGSVTGNVGGNVAGSVGSVTAPVTVGTNNDKTGYSLASAPPTALAIASQVRTELTTELGRIDAAISTRSTYAGTDTSGTTTLLSRLSSGRAGNLDNLDATVSSRLASASYSAPLDAAGVAGAVWNAATASYGSAGSYGLLLETNLDAAVSGVSTAVWGNATRTLTAGTNIVLAKGTGVTGFSDLDAAGVRSAVGLASANLDTQLSTLSSYVDTEVAAIKAVTDKLDTALELDGSVYRYTTNALEQGPSGGAGTSDWTADERTAIRAILGIPGSGTTPADPSAGILDTIRDYLDTEVAAIKAKTDNLPASPAATGDVPSAVAIASQVRTELTTELGRIDAAISTRSTYAGTDTAGTTTLLSRLSSQRATNLDNLDAAVSGVSTGGVSAADIAAAVFDTTIEGSRTYRQLLRLYSAVWLANASGLLPDTQHIFRDLGNTKNRVVADFTGSNRTVTIVDAD